MESHQIHPFDHEEVQLTWNSTSVDVGGPDFGWPHADVPSHYGMASGVHPLHLSEFTAPQSTALYAEYSVRAEGGEVMEEQWPRANMDYGQIQVQPYEAYAIPPHSLLPPHTLLPHHVLEDVRIPTAPRKRRSETHHADTASMPHKLFSLADLGTEVRYGLGSRSFYRLDIAQVLQDYNPWFWRDVVMPDMRYRHLDVFYSNASRAPSVPVEYRLDNGTTIHMPNLSLFSDASPFEPLKLPENWSCSSRTVQAPHASPSPSSHYDHAHLNDHIGDHFMNSISESGELEHKKRDSNQATKPFPTSSTLKVPCWFIGGQSRYSESFARDILGAAVDSAPIEHWTLELVLHHSKKHWVFQSSCKSYKHKHSIHYHDIARIMIYDVQVEGSGKPRLVAVTLAVTERGDDSFKRRTPDASDDVDCDCPPIMPYFNRPLGNKSTLMGKHPEFVSPEKHDGEFYLTVVMDYNYFVKNERGLSGCTPMERMVLGDPYLASITMVQQDLCARGMEKLTYRATSLWNLRDRFALVLEVIYRALKMYGPDQLSLAINTQLNHTFKWPRCSRPCCSDSRLLLPKDCSDDEISDSTLIGAESSLSSAEEEEHMMRDHMRPDAPLIQYSSCSEAEETDLGDGEMSDDGDYEAKLDEVDELVDDDVAVYERRKPRRARNLKKRKVSSSFISDEEMDEEEHVPRKRRGSSKKSKPKRDSTMGAVPEDTFAFNYSDIMRIAELFGVEIMSKDEAMYFMEVAHVGRPGICNYRRTFLELSNSGKIVMPLQDHKNEIDTSKLMPLQEWNKQLEESQLAPSKRAEAASMSPMTSPMSSERFDSPYSPIGVARSVETLSEAGSESTSVGKKTPRPKGTAQSPHIRVACLCSKKILVALFGPWIERLWKHD